jgi:hypothetical protein
MLWPLPVATCTLITSTLHRICPYLSSTGINLFSKYCSIANHSYDDPIIQQYSPDMPPPSMPTNATTSSNKLSAPEKLTQLRAVMKQHSLQALYVPSEDAHSNEYISPSDARRAFISGFTGSAGKDALHSLA